MRALKDHQRQREATDDWKVGRISLSPAGFCPETKNGKMTLMNPAGLIADEGADGAPGNGLKPKTLVAPACLFFNDAR